jgi:hypothetical protein
MLRLPRSPDRLRREHAGNPGHGDIRPDTYVNGGDYARGTLSEAALVEALTELAALIALMPVLVANNIGPAHIAAAVGTPVVDLYALTNPQHRPWSVPSRVLPHDVSCRNCYKSICPQGHHDCLRLVPPDAVYQAALDLLGRRRAALACVGAQNQIETGA